MIPKPLYAAAAAALLMACSDEPDAQDRYEAALVDLAETRRAHMQNELDDVRAELARGIQDRGHPCDRVIGGAGAEVICQTPRGEVTYRLRANGDVVPAN